MTTLFTRGGSEKTPNATDDKGRPTWRHTNPCHRCGGLGGGEQWRHTGWTCFECGGTGHGASRNDRLYTQPELDKLNAALGKRRAKVDAARAAVVAEREAEKSKIYGAWFESNKHALYFIAQGANCFDYLPQIVRDVVARFEQGDIVSERSIDVCLGIIVQKLAERDEKAASAHFGKIGERLNITFEVTFCLRFESTHYGWPASYLTVGRTPEGNVVVYKGSNGWDKGDTVTAKWTIKDHSEREGVLQTVLARPTFPKERA